MNETRWKRVNRARGADLRIDSLVGSYFVGTAPNDWTGCVVAEVSPGVYLVELQDSGGTSTGQKLISLEDMKSWTFYDDEASRSGAATRTQGGGNK